MILQLSVTGTGLGNLLYYYILKEPEEQEKYGVLCVDIDESERIIRYC